MERNQPAIFRKLLQEEILFFNYEASTTAIVYRDMDAIRSLKVNLHDMDDDDNTLLHFIAKENYLSAANLTLSADA